MDRPIKERIEILEAISNAIYILNDKIEFFSPDGESGFSPKTKALKCEACKMMVEALEELSKAI